MVDTIELKRQRAVLDLMIRQAENFEHAQHTEKAFSLFDSLPRGERISMLTIRQAGAKIGILQSPKRWRMMLNTWAGMVGVSIKVCKRENNRAIYLN